MPRTLKALFPLTAQVTLILILAGGSAFAADFYLYAGQTTLVMPDAANVPAWGFALEPDNDFTVLDGTVVVPGPRLTVDPADGKPAGGAAGIELINGANGNCPAPHSATSWQF